MITAWILVIAATYGNSAASVFSAPVADLASCERLKEASTGGIPRTATCVQVRILK